MSHGEDRVIVSSGATAGLSAAHHRDFPEIRAEGESPADAASQLVHHLTRALDTALTDWRRSAIEQAIADVKAYSQQA
ncbi:hypothetical protein [Tautonia plasticadhaerens]|uniref:Uncharacterized protein n=1 Tax=Tautonia plasticadhaerens TaxID=2527974 RepID=A0A518GXH9_9BACT|nr:hypothetical protein [Tautonia plasticadhaerens]QDV33298.1 hypothetical protein ElP_11410 [Tautonia plasticadhaerens]